MVADRSNESTHTASGLAVATAPWSPATAPASQVEQHDSPWLALLRSRGTITIDTVDDEPLYKIEQVVRRRALHHRVHAGFDLLKFRDEIGVFVASRQLLWGLGAL